MTPTLSASDAEYVVLSLPPAWKGITVVEAIARFAMHEATGIPIILDSGQKAHPEGWLRWLQITAEEVLS